MTRCICRIGIVLFLVACSSSKKSETQNEWIQLFNGHDIADWIVKVHHHDPGVNFGNTFRVEEGMIKVRYDQYGSYNDQFAHLYYKTLFHIFISSWNITLRANFSQERLIIPCLIAGSCFILRIHVKC